MADKILRIGGRGDDGTAKAIRTDNEGNTLVKLTGSNLAEQKTQADLSTGKVTFAQPIKFIGIYNRDTVNDGVFVINGISVTMPPGEYEKFQMGGTPSAEITVTGSTSFILSRFE